MFLLVDTESRRTLSIYSCSACVSLISFISICLMSWLKSCAMFVSSFAETRKLPMKRLASANYSIHSWVWNSSSGIPLASLSESRSNLLTARTMGIGESCCATMSSTCSFHLAVASIESMSLISPTNMAPLAFLQNYLFIPAKLVSMPIKSQTWSLISVPPRLIILTWKSGDTVAL